MVFAHLTHIHSINEVCIRPASQTYPGDTMTLKSAFRIAFAYAVAGAAIAAPMLAQAGI